MPARKIRSFLLYALLLTIGSFQACSCEDTQSPETNNSDDVDMSDDVTQEDDADTDFEQDIDPCSPELNRCRGDEVCTASIDGTADCACPAGTHPENDSCIEDTMCTPSTCNMHGTCADAAQGPSCSCEQGWDSDFCDTCDTNAGWQDDGNGGCTNDPCSRISCGDKVCVLDQGVATCQCPAGTHPQDDACEPDRTCLANSCNMRGTCDDTGGVVACACDTGFAGEACDACDAMAGFHDDGNGGCTTDVCLPNPCVEPQKSVCTGAGNTFTCACDTGNHDDGAGNCVIDEVCILGSCNGNGTCNDTGGILTCTCDTGFDGEACDTCDVSAGYHLDGAGGCTTDPCLPNPCTLVADKTQCTSQGTGFMCGCALGFHDDGAGGCTTDPCLPDLCSALNQACRVTGNAAECYTPVCNDMNPCTDDTLVNGACVYTNVTDGATCATSACMAGESCTAGICGGGAALVCDDSNDCTDDTCDPTSGCVFTNDDTNIPNDNIGCTDDTCSGGFASHTTSDANCDDALYCNGVETCAPADSNANANGCLTQNVPIAPTDPGPCSYYGACDDTTDAFPLLSRSNGAACNDGVLCTTGDVCNAQGQCRGTQVGSCGLPSTCGSTSLFTGDINIPDATLNLTITLDGQPLPDSGSDSTAHYIYAVAKDTGVRHQISYFYWDTYYNPDIRRFDATRLMPGVYDILYRTGETSNDSGYVYRTESTDIGPNAVRMLAQDVTIYAGVNDLAVDIPQTNITLNVTLNGQSMPDSGSDSTAHYIYAVSQDTGARHQISYFYWDTYYTPDIRRFDAERLMPGTYDILYRTGETSTDSGYVYRTENGDIGPNAVQWLARDVVVSGGNTTIDVDIPETTITLDITLNGAPLPDTGSDSTAHYLYAVNKDTGVRHQISYFYWDTYYNPDIRRFDAERLMPGTYDILYRTGETSTDSGYVYRTESSDIGPNAVRVLVSDLVVAGAAQNIAVNIPDANITLDITLDGQPLPDSGSDPTAHYIYAVSKDTGVRHQLSYFYWDTYYNPDLRRFDAERLMPGTYDILYRTGETSTDSGYVYRTESTDIGPNAVRLLATNVVITAGANTIAVDIPQTQITLDITLNGAPLPESGSDSSAHYIYAVAKDTGVRHQLAYFYWDTYYNPDIRRFDAERLMPGIYDILYRKGETTTDSGYVYRTDSTDVGPNGVRLLATDVVIAGNAQTLNLDIPQVPLAFNITLAGQPLPLSGNDASANYIYAVSRDTGKRHQLSYFYWDNYYNPDIRKFDAERLMPGKYDILYRKGETTTDSGYVYRTDSSDITPNGVRYLGVCLDIQ